MSETYKNKIFERLSPHLKNAAKAVRTVSSFGFNRGKMSSPQHPKSESSDHGIPFSEKRKIEKRVSAKIPVRYLAIEGEQEHEILEKHHDQVQVSFSKNISSGGIFLCTQEELTVESLLRLHLFLPSSVDFVSVLARVMWTDQEGAGLCFVGMKQKEMERLKEELVRFNA